MTGAEQLALDGTAATVGARPDDDHYRTPTWLVEAVLAQGLSIPPRAVLDAGAGDGRLGRAVARRFRDAATWGVEIDPARLASSGLDRQIEADFLAWAPTCDRTFDCVIANPPFRLWDEFARAMLPLVAPGGTCLVLGFVNVLGGQARAAWWREHPPSRIWLSPRRASFTPDGATDSRDCCWISWEPGERRAEVRWLPTELG